MQRLWQTFRQDLRYGMRVLIKKPVFTLIAVLTLALGIGANTAIFSVVNAVLLRPLPYADPGRLVMIQETRGNGNPAQVTPANFIDWRAQNSVFEQLAATATRDVNLTGVGEPERVTMTIASANLFDLLGAKPILGRVFRPDEEQVGHAPVTVISHGLWQRRFGGDQSLVGKTISLDGQSYTVIGIAPPGFDYPWKTAVWISPLRLAPELNPQMDVTRLRGFGYLYAIARLKPGISIEGAQADMDTVTGRLRQQYPDTNGNRFDRVVSLQTYLVGDLKKALLVLLGAVGCVLLIACANVANLLLARNAARQKELAIRTALGANRARLARQLLTESLWLALGGGLIGCWLAWWGIDLLLVLMPSDLPGAEGIGVDPSVLGFTLGLSLLTGFLFGLAPAWQVSRTDINAALGEAVRGASAGAGQSRLRSALIVAEVALSLMLLAGAGLLFRSFTRLQAINPGYEPQQVLTMRLAPSGSAYSTSEQQRAFYDRVIERTQTLPGVQVVSAINVLPLSRGPQAGFRIEGHPPVLASQLPGANNRIITPDYFRALGIPIMRGRGFDDRDQPTTANVVIVNQTLARRNFPQEEALGKRISFATNERGEPLWFEIIGISADTRNLDLRTEPDPDFFVLHRQVSLGGMSLVIRTTGEPEGIAAAVRQGVLDVDRNQPISEVKTLEQIVYQSVARPRFNLLLLGLFAAVAMLLAAAGIYGVMSYTVAQRTRELGIRLALGAQPRDVLRLIIKQGMTLALGGVGIGLVAALALTHLMKSLLFGISATDPLTFATIAVLLTGVALIACYVPARRATRVDPLEALRHE
jgi:putative ABC transport system permease protein